jgi:predicted Zn finger-like uncharacterized protein
MKILKQGKLPNPTWVRTCGNCQTQFEYDRSDIHSDQREGDYVKCPTCTKYINHSTNNFDKFND